MTGCWTSIRCEANAAMLFAFDLIEHDGDDLRDLPLIERKWGLFRLLGKAKRAIRFVEHLTGDGPTVFEHVCRIGAGGHRIEANGRALSQRAVEAVGQDEEPGERGGAPGARGGVVALALPGLHRCSCTIKSASPCTTITNHRGWMPTHPQRAPRPRAGSLPIIPPQFFDRQLHRPPVAFLSISPPFDQSLLPFLGSCHEDLVELMLDPRINPEAADRPVGPSDAGPSDADRPFGPSKADKTRPAQPLRGVPLPSIILPSIRIPVALPCLVFIVGVQSTKPFPASDCFKKGCFCWATGTKPTDPGLWPDKMR